jgi:hypothetical protein
VPADLSAIIEDFRLRAEIAVGATAASPRYEAQINYLQEQFLAKFDASTAGDGARAVSTSTEGGSFAVQYPGASDQDIAHALRLLIRELQQQVNNSQKMPARGIRWSTRFTEA